jgi:hypothetical protein
VVLLEDCVEASKIGLVVSAVPTVLRECGKAVLAFKREAEKQERGVGRVVEGKQIIEGMIVSLKTQDSMYGTQFKMLVEVAQEDGVVRLWGTEPRGLNPEIGDRVRFSATVQRSDGDADFGFYSRPTKSEILAPANA